MLFVKKQIKKMLTGLVAMMAILTVTSCVSSPGREGMQQWAAAGTVDELSGIWASVPPPLPPR